MSTIPKPSPRLRMNGERTTVDNLVDASQAAERLCTTERHVRRLYSERRLPFVKVGKVVRFRPEDLDAFVEANRIGAVR